MTLLYFYEYEHVIDEKGKSTFIESFGNYILDELPNMEQAGNVSDENE